MTAATYDGNGVRASTTITPAGGTAVTQGYVWNTAPQTPTAPQTSQLLMDGTNAYIYDGGLAPAEQVSLSGGTITYLDTDALGSVRGTVSSSGSLTGTTAYDAWGNPETSGGLSATTPFGFAGGYTDPDGLIYLLNRYYDPGTGQFLSVDPDLAQTQEPYAYAGGDPVINTDPTGDEWVFKGWTFATTQWFGTSDQKGVLGWISRHISIDLNFKIVSLHINNIQEAFTYWVAAFQWYDGDAPTPWFFAFYYIATWVRAHVQLEVSVNILGVTFHKSLYDGDTPDILAAECGGWVKWYESRIEGAAACKPL